MRSAVVGPHLLQLLHATAGGAKQRMHVSSCCPKSGSPKPATAPHTWPPPGGVWLPQPGWLNTRVVRPPDTWHILCGHIPSLQGRLNICSNIPNQPTTVRIQQQNTLGSVVASCQRQHQTAFLRQPTTTSVLLQPCNPRPAQGASDAQMHASSRCSSCRRCCRVQEEPRMLLVCMRATTAAAAGPITCC